MFDASANATKSTTTPTLCGLPRNSSSRRPPDGQRDPAIDADATGVALLPRPVFYGRRSLTNAECGLDEHDEIIEALRNHDARKSGDVMVRHLEHVTTRMVLEGKSSKEAGPGGHPQAIRLLIQSCPDHFHSSAGLASREFRTQTPRVVGGCRVRQGRISARLHSGMASSHRAANPHPSRKAPISGGTPPIVTRSRSRGWPFTVEASMAWVYG